MNLLNFKNPEDMVQKTKLPVGECLRLVEAELQKSKAAEAPKRREQP